MLLSLSKFSLGYCVALCNIGVHQHSTFMKGDIGVHQHSTFMKGDIGVQQHSTFMKGDIGVH